MVCCIVRYGVSANHPFSGEPKHTYPRLPPWFSVCVVYVLLWGFSRVSFDTRLPMVICHGTPFCLDVIKVWPEAARRAPPRAICRCCAKNRSGRPTHTFFYTIVASSTQVEQYNYCIYKMPAQSECVCELISGIFAETHRELMCSFSRSLCIPK